MKDLILILIIVAACVFSLSAAAQCNTTLNQLLPEEAVNNDDRFAGHMAANGQYLVITAENSDTLGIMYGGAAYVYEKTVAGWAYRAMLIASDPEEWSFFGTHVAIDDDGTTIVVLDRLYPHNRIYIFERPASGWETMTETFQLVSPDYADVDASIDISGDGNRIVVNHPWSKTPNFAVFHKPATGWLAAAPPQIITGPTHEFNSTLFALSALMHDDYLYVSATNDPIGTGIYVYKLNGGLYEYLAKLSLSTPHNSTHKFGYHITATDDMVATTGLVLNEEADGRARKVFVFRKDGEWKDALETAQFEVADSEVNISVDFPVEFLSSTVMASSIRVKDGDWYRGRLVVTKATDETWQSVTNEVIFESEQLNSRFDFTRDLIWNGSELLQSLATMPAGLTTRDAVLSLTRSGDIWGSLQRISIPRNNSANFSFGNSVHKSGNTLFAGAPYDGTVGRGAGAVYVYEKSGDAYQKVHKILPPARKPNANGTLDTGFGYSIATFGDELAISAPSYRYGDEGLGKIYLYRRTGTSWASAELYDSILPPAEMRMNRVGAAITMNARYLFASAYLSTQYNGVAIFEKIDGEWIYKEAVAAGRPLDKSWPSVRMSLHGNTLLVGAFRTLGGGTFIFEEDADYGNWKATSRISADAVSTFGNDVKLMENHFFVGNPTHAYNGIENSGAVFVYARIPGRPWTSEMEPVAIIGANTPIADAYFGSSIDAVGNTLVVGAPGGSRTTNGEVRTIPGNTYIFQTEDFYWTNTTEYLNLQGSRYAFKERDYFGFDVGVDEENFYIGAMNENTSAGAFSGAVYYIPTPPLIFLIPPICKEEEFVQLEGYPFYGTWSGPGVEDPSGRFNPDLSGEGFFFLTYETEYCAYKGTVKVEVAADPTVNRVSPEHVEICSEGGTQLQLTEVAGAEYNWYFKAAGRDGLFFIGSLGAKAQVSNPGEYFAAVSNDFCTVNSSSFNVSIEAMPEVVIGPQPVVCDHHEIVPLSISVDHGTWEGTGIQDNRFHAGTLPNGKYPLVYRFTTPLGCRVAVKDTIQKIRVNEMTLNRVPGDFCKTGTATLQANTTDASLRITWFYRSNLVGAPKPVDLPLPASAAFYQPGYYYLSATNGYCTAYSDTLQVGFNDDLEYQLQPEALNPEELCEGDVYDLQVNTRPQTTLEWFYAPDKEEDFELIPAESKTTLSVMETGYYKVSGTYGFCSFESAPVYVSFKLDSIWVPNVFTPNGDAANEVFSVQTNSDDLQLRIFSRYGKQIYITEGKTWDGGDAPSGTYYWYVNYLGCRGEGTNARGWVRLMR